MLSILIPTYNTEIVDLVEDLYDQCRSLNIDFEIRCYDDGSLAKYKEINKSVAEYKRVVYKEMEVNLGRARIRNLLADDAQYEQLLFLDADSGIIRDDFIFTYIKQMTNSVIYGGRIYSETAPADRKKILHWKYGRGKESLDEKTRNNNPYLNFLSNNFIIDKNIFKKIKFDDDHSGYGYEDTLFAMELSKQNTEIRHIDNPVIHLGLEDDDIFMQKTINAIENLSVLYIKNKIIDTRLINTYEKLKKTGLSGLFGNIIYLLKKPILKNLYSGKPNLVFLQLLKLGLFISSVKSIKSDRSGDPDKM